MRYDKFQMCDFYCCRYFTFIWGFSHHDKNIFINNFEFSLLIEMFLPHIDIHTAMILSDKLIVTIRTFLSIQHQSPG